MKTILKCGLIFAIFGLTSCENTHKNPVVIRAQYQVIEIDSCEYVVAIPDGFSRSIVHKGNCKNPIHQIVREK